MIITYGVFGKVELVISLTIGVKTIPIDFEGGSISSRGISPAIYKTNSPIIQKGIESSHEFKHGIIRIISRIPEKTDIIATPKMKETKNKAHVGNSAFYEGERTKADVSDKETNQVSESTKDSIPVPEPVKNDSNGIKEDENPKMIDDAYTQVMNGELKKEVTVTCLEDAVEYLKNNYEGYTSSKLRTKNAVERAAEEHGITFVGL